MSKRKRLGRGLEALLGVGGGGDKTSNQDGAPPTAESNDSSARIEPSAEDSKFNSGDSDSSDPSELISESNDSPTILKFTAKEDPAAKPSAKHQSSASLTASGNETLIPGIKPESSESQLVGKVEDPMPKSGNSADDRKLDQAIVSTMQSDHASDDGSSIVELNVYDVDDNPFQPRREFNKSEIESLAESLKTHEQLQPILVRRVGERYQLISGERRLRAAIHAGWSRIRAQVRDADDRLVAELAIVENLQRKDLNPVEKALSFRRYLDEHHCSQENLAGRLKIDRSTVANLLRLLELPEVVQKAIQMGIISNGHARALLPLGEEHLQIEFCNRIQREGLSVRAIEQLVRERIDEEDGVKRKSAAKGRTKSGQILSLEKELRNALGTKVEIKTSSRGRGKIIVHYTSREEFERLQDQFNESGGRTNRDAA